MESTKMDTAQVEDSDRKLPRFTSEIVRTRQNPTSKIRRKRSRGVGAWEIVVCIVIDYFRILRSSWFFRIIWISFSFSATIKWCVKLEGIILCECENHYIIIVIGSYRDWRITKEFSLWRYIIIWLLIDLFVAAGKLKEIHLVPKKLWTYSIYLKFEKNVSHLP